MERFGETKKSKRQDGSDTGDKNIVEGVAQKWLTFMRFILEKRARS